VQLRHDTNGRAYYRRKLAEGKTGMEAGRCLKRRLSDVVFRQLVADAEAGHEPKPEAGPGGHSEATLTSSAADPTPHVGTSDQPQTDSAERREESPPGVLESGHNPAPSAAAAQDDSRAAASA
jgi:transposase